MSKKQAFNPYLPSYEYIPDGEPRIFEDRLYIYGSHDRFGSAGFCLNDYVCYSADLNNLAEWRYEGVIYPKTADPRNQNIPEDAPEQQLLFGIKPEKEEDLNPRGIHAQFAPDVIQGPDGRYYLYYGLDFLPEIGVAVCDTPAGKYEYLGLVKHADGIPLGQKKGDLIQFDPGIYVEGNEIYLYSGNAPIAPEYENGTQASQVMKLMPDMVTLKEEPKKLLPSITESAGTGYEGHEFFEASSIRKNNGLYYLVYSSVKSSELCYAVSEKPDEGYRYGGTLVDIGDLTLRGKEEGEAINPLGNTHGGMVCVKGQWYIFYHRQTARTNFSRQGCAEKIYIKEDGSIDQAEVTSCGLNDGPLEGKGVYPARICCHLTGSKPMCTSHPRLMKMDYPFLTQDCYDIEPESEEAKQEKEFPVQYIANIQDKNIVGYKYFDFKDTKKLTLTIRARSQNVAGKILVGQSLEDFSCGIIPVEISENTEKNWITVSCELLLEKGTYPLYLKYEGVGEVDLAQFELI
ncbi:hypothetical protein DW904_01100 [Ruminococcus sp. AM42-11]|uniref:family 43 glycosylhydrolase n=1 Tax=Ruminococcus sp. AM42-11 TaxID=2292372 RepID=UPI000E539B64|nr:family 43 glycosylhydrolase [Ruminococcus sp. AM42-11]RHT03996.1 hypothetical protein DW904_01100 [Ruminococcus sp. AM42-11]